MKRVSDETYCLSFALRSAFENPGDQNCPTVDVIRRIRLVIGGSDLVTTSCPTLVTPWAVACQVPLSMGFSRWEYWSGLSFPSPAGHECLIYSYLTTCHAKLLQSCLTVCNPMDSSPPGSSVHGILQARILEWVDPISSFRGSSRPRDQTKVSCLLHWQVGSLPTSAIWEAYSYLIEISSLNYYWIFHW